MDNKMSKENFLAVNVMGWSAFHPDEEEQVEWDQIWLSRIDDINIPLSEWQPRKNIAQAFELWNKFNVVHLTKDTDKSQWEFVCEIENTTDGNVSIGMADDPAMAIFEAALKASGYYE